jgi:16S rRNA (adenine1518-N6/adenine1519-N6)-dimethyltransferase
MRTKKYWGQHFLIDPNMARKIVNSIPGHATAHIFEVGPGKGMLTRHLASLNPDSLTVIEIDPEAVAYLEGTFSHPALRILHGDFLTLDLRMLYDHPITLAGNFPYNISSQIFFRILHHKDLVHHVVGMIQKEVAERIAAPPGSKTYGILSVLLSTFYSVENLFTVSAGVFDPRPNVQSAVIRLTRNNVLALPCDEHLYFKVVKSSFNQRRKILRNSLKSFFVNLPMHLEVLQKRPEQLHHEDFIELTCRIEEHLEKGHRPNSL